MKKPEDFAVSDRGPCVHLRSTAARRSDDPVRNVPRNRHALIRAAAIDDNNFQLTIETPDPPQESADQRAFVQNGNDDGNRCRIRVRRHNKTTSSTRFPVVSKISNRETK